jgi:hypothetical protein
MATSNKLKGLTPEEIKAKLPKNFVILLKKRLKGSGCPSSSAYISGVINKMRLESPIWKEIFKLMKEEEERLMANEKIFRQMEQYVKQNTVQE